MNRSVILIMSILLSSSIVSAAITSFDVDSVTSGGDRIIGPDSTFTVTFDTEPDSSFVTLNLNYDDRGIDRFQPSRCTDTTCTFSSVPLDEGWIDAYVTYYSHERSLRLYADTQGPLVTQATFEGSSVSITLSDRAGVADYRLQRSGSIIATGSGTSVSATLTTPLAIGNEAFFTLVSEDALGNVAVENFGGIVETVPISIQDIDTRAVLGSNDLATISFSVAGPLDPGSAAIYVDGTRYGAICGGTITSCLASFPASVGSAQVLALVSSPFGSRASRTQTVQLVADSSAPEFVSISTPFLSYSGTEQYADDSFTLNFEEDGMIDPYSVEAEVNGIVKTASSCARAGSVVSCEVPISGSGDATIEFITARDTAGNPVEFPDGAITATTLSRDMSAPRVDSLAIRDGSGVTSRATEFTISSTGTITIIADVDAEGSRLGVLDVFGSTDSGEWSGTYGFTCATQGLGSARCTSDPIPIIESTRLELALFDGSGIPHRASRLITVSAGAIDEGIHDWDIVRIDPIQGYFIEGGVLPTTVEVEVGAPTISSAMSLAGVSVSSCDGINDPFAASNGEVITITGFVSGSALTDDTATCTLELTTMRNGRIESGSQTIKVEIPYDDIANAGIRDPLEHYRDNAGFRQAGVALDWMEEVLGYGEAICTGYEAANLASLITNLAADAAGGVTNPVGAALSTVGLTLFQSVDGLGTIADKFCPVVQCEVPLPGQSELPVEERRTFQDAVLETYNAVEGPVIASINDGVGLEILSSDIGADRVQDSIILSAISMCLPGVIENANEIVQVECGRQLCLLQIHTGDYRGSAAMCDYAANIQQCVFVADELFAIMPFGTFAEGFGSIIEGIGARPLQMAVSWGIDAAVSASPTLRAALNADLGMLLTFMGANAQAAAAEAADEIPDYCEELREYVEDLNENRGYNL